MTRIIRAALTVADHVIIMADADGGPVKNKREKILQHIDAKHRESTHIVNT